MPFPNMVVVDEQGAPMVGLEVIVVNVNGTTRNEFTDEDGEVRFADITGDPREAWITAEGYHAVHYQEGGASQIQMRPLSRGGSIVIDSVGYIPNLGGGTDQDGRLNPIHDSNGRDYLYASNLAFNGTMDGSPFAFRYSEPFTLTDSQGRMVEVKILARAGSQFLVEYQRVD